MENFVQNLLQDYFLKKLDYHRWYGFRFFFGDINLIWTAKNDLLDHLISYTQNYSKSKNMKCKIKFEVHLSTSEAHFLDVMVFLRQHERIISNTII